jgi:hypothetical protein
VYGNVLSDHFIELDGLVVRYGRQAGQYGRAIVGPSAAAGSIGREKRINQSPGI